jgi:2-hydroxychromene-2-carboxylate isomerase
MELELWFEFGSTYSYLSACRIEAVCDAVGVPLRRKPFLLGPIFAAQGWNDSPFNIYPAKGRYMWRDMERQCEKYALPFKRPSQFPRNGLLAARIACSNETALWLPAFVRGVFTANFADDRDISRPEVISEIVSGLGQNAEAMLDRATSTASKQRLREQTERATQLGIFGAPSFIVDGDLFWGNDRLGDAVATCKLGKR